MDDVDRELLALLRRDARAPYTELARRLDLSEGAVRSRVKSLVDDGTIQRFTIETRSAGIQALVQLSVRVNVESGGIAEEILAIDGVDRVRELSGDTDLIVDVHVAGTEQLNDVIDAVRRTGSIESTRTSIVLKEHRT